MTHVHFVHRHATCVVANYTHSSCSAAQRPLTGNTRRLLEPFLAKYKVHLYLNGHMHLMEVYRSLRGSVGYTGMLHRWPGPRTPPPLFPAQTMNVAHCQSAAHCQRVTFALLSLHTGSLDCLLRGLFHLMGQMSYPSDRTHHV